MSISVNRSGAVPSKLYVGWDVGGWHCDRNKASRDALVVTAICEGQITIVGRARRGNLRSLLVSKSGSALVAAMLEFCGVAPSEPTEVVVAIDTPLGWPWAMMQLASGGAVSSVSAADGENPYTRRATELALIRRGFSPLSAVRDMLGSQSTKGIHFLRAADLAERSPGVWRSRDGATTAIETYPAVALQMDSLRRLHAKLVAAMAEGLNGDLHDDVRDALACSLVAYLFAEQPDAIDPVPVEIPAGEGWIILPRE
jgi:hypothetical protein